MLPMCMLFVVATFSLLMIKTGGKSSIRQHYVLLALNIRMMSWLFKENFLEEDKVLFRGLPRSHQADLSSSCTGTSWDRLMSEFLMGLVIVCPSLRMLSLGCLFCYHCMPDASIPFTPLNNPSSFLPQGLCTCWWLCLDSFLLLSLASSSSSSEGSNILE